MALSIVGKRIPRLDAADQATGLSRYVDDLPEPPGTLYAAVLTSPYASAEILKLDVSKAEQLEGVAAVVTAKDVPNNIIGLAVQDEYVMADKQTHYVGEAVAAVAAETVEIARKALTLIDVEYKELNPVFDPREAMKTDSVLVHEGKENVAVHFKLRKGDMERGFKEADLIVEDTIESQPVEHCSIEPHGGLAQFDEKGKLTVWSSTQLPFILRIFLQMIFMMPATQIRVIKPKVGGAFGGKNELGVEHHIALLAKKSGRPVKMIWSREDEFRRSTRRHRMFMSYKTGVKNDGTLTAMQVEQIIDNGPIVGWSIGVPAKAYTHLGPYRVPNAKVDNYLIYTNMAPTCAMRGFGGTTPAFGFETHLDNVAQQININPVAFRLKNALKPGDKLANGQILGTCGLTECITSVAERSNLPLK